MFYLIYKDSKPGLWDFKGLTIFITYKRDSLVIPTIIILQKYPKGSQETIPHMRVSPIRGSLITSFEYMYISIGRKIARGGSYRNGGEGGGTMVEVIHGKDERLLVVAVIIMLTVMVVSWH